jgi:hypothetical protein
MRACTAQVKHLLRVLAQMEARAAVRAEEEARERDRRALIALREQARRALCDAPRTCRATHTWHAAHRAAPSTRRPPPQRTLSTLSTRQCAAQRCDQCAAACACAVWCRRARNAIPDAVGLARWAAMGCGSGLFSVSTNAASASASAARPQGQGMSSPRSARASTHAHTHTHTHTSTHARTPTHTHTRTSTHIHFAQSKERA